MNTQTEKTDDVFVDNTTGISRALEYGDIQTMSTILGPKFSPAKAGIIRPGIMALKKDSISDDDRKRFAELLDAGENFKEIEKKLGKDAEGKSKLRPMNVDYFTIHTRDCKVPSAEVDKISKLYADKDGKLRSFPVWFGANEWWNIVPHSLRCFGTNGIKFKSNFRQKVVDGKVVDVERICEFPKDAKPGKKVFGGRDWDTRPCDPDTCKEYQSGACKFGGAIQFYIPGIKGVGVWVLPTVSWYSLVDIKNALETVAAMSGGKLAGLFDGKPIFRLMKVEDTVSRIDTASGKAVKADQFLIHLDVDVDLTEVIAFSERARERGNRAISIFNGAAGKSVSAASESSSGSRPGGEEKVEYVIEHSDGEQADGDGGSKLADSAGEIAGRSAEGDGIDSKSSSEGLLKQDGERVDESVGKEVSAEGTKKLESSTDNVVETFPAVRTKEDVKAAFKKAFATTATKDEVNATWRLVVENCDPSGEKLLDNLKLDGKDKADLQPVKAEAIERIKKVTA